MVAVCQSIPVSIRMKESIVAGESVHEPGTHPPVPRARRAASLPKCPGSQERRG